MTCVCSELGKNRLERRLRFALSENYPSYSELMVVTILVGVLNGYWHRASVVVDRVGFAEALAVTFEISLVVWVAVFVLVQLLREVDPYSPGVRDLAIVIFAAFTFLFPLSAVSWFGLLAVALNTILFHAHIDKMRRCGWLLLALCLSGYLARAFSSYFMGYFLVLDAQIVSFLTGTSALGNTIIAADGVTRLIVLEACSSFTNVSVAFLAWMIARAHFGTRGLRRSACFILLSACAVILINSIRIGTIALRPDMYEIMHGSFGASFANILSSVAIGLISWRGARL